MQGEAYGVVFLGRHEKEKTKKKETTILVREINVVFDHSLYLKLFMIFLTFKGCFRPRSSVEKHFIFKANNVSFSSK